ncbi:hypothetical protein CGRA01v4_04206 [Colletotrichum graminicola]|nr:hypothetical protein CGRA01v4_04206 [Colletotrichum graminicola]
MAKTCQVARHSLAGILAYQRLRHIRPQSTSHAHLGAAKMSAVQYDEPLLLTTQTESRAGMLDRISRICPHSECPANMRRHDMIPSLQPDTYGRVTYPRSCPCCPEKCRPVILVACDISRHISMSPLDSESLNRTLSSRPPSVWASHSGWLCFSADPFSHLPPVSCPGHRESGHAGTASWFL